MWWSSNSDRFQPPKLTVGGESFVAQGDRERYDPDRLV
jgi:hypothetical protein